MMKKFKLVNNPLGFHSVEINPKHFASVHFNTAVGTANVELCNGAVAKFYDDGDFKDEGLERKSVSMEVYGTRADFMVR